MEKGGLSWAWTDGKICIGRRKAVDPGAQGTEGTDVAVGKLLSGGSRIRKCAC